MQKKRTLEALRQDVAERVMRDDQRITQTPGVIRPTTISPEGAQINGPDLQAASPALDKVADDTDRKIIEGMFSGFTKYQTLGMLLDASGKWFKRYPAQMEELAMAATATDHAAKHNTRIG